MLKNWLNIYLYQIKKNKFFTALNILGLSIGIAGLIFAILYWNDEHSYDAWNPEKDRIFLFVNQIDENVFWTSGSAAVGPNLAAKSDEVESYCYLNDYYADDIISAGGKKMQFSKILDAQRTFFEFFPFEFMEGNIKTAMPDENSICLSEDTAQQLFQNEPALGKEVVYSGKKLVVRGVYRLTGKAAYQPMAVVNFIDATLKGYETQWGNFNFGLYIKAKKASDKESILATIDALNYENMTVVYAKKMGISVADYKKKWGDHKVLLEPLSDVRLHTKSGGVAEGKGNYQFLLSMMGLSILILVLSVFNYINLATANAIKRAKEVGVRKVLGASKKNIVVQFIAEATLNVFVAILLALVIVELSLPYYNSFLDKHLILNSETFFMQLLLIMVVTIITAGVFPALYVSNFETLKVLKGNFGRSKAGIWLRNGMLVLQFAIASFFIVGSYIVYEQIDFMNKKDLGFKGEQVVDVVYRNIYGDGISNQMRYDKYLRIKNELLKIKGVKEVSGGTLGFGYGISSTISYNYKDEVINGQNVALDFGMLELMNIQLKEGRFLNAKYASDTIDNMLVNETAMKLMKEKSVIGKEVDWNGKKMKIVGVVKDFNVEGPHNPIEAVSIFHFKNVDWLLNNLHNIYIKIDPENMDETVAEIEQFWVNQVDPDYPFTYDFVNKEYARSYGQFVKQRNLFSLLNFVVIVIALMGLFALASYSIQTRMKEIAIRKTLGAETKTLLKELSKQYILFCVIGFVIALFPVYFLLDKWLENFAYRIDISVIPFVIGFVILLLLTLVVVLSRAFQATRVEVLKYLKYE